MANSLGVGPGRSGTALVPYQHTTVPSILWASGAVRNKGSTKVMTNLESDDKIFVRYIREGGEYMVCWELINSN